MAKKALATDEVVEAFTAAFHRRVLAEGEELASNILQRKNVKTEVN
jgi:hypothetical protein